MLHGVWPFRLHLHLLILCLELSTVAYAANRQLLACTPSLVNDTVLPNPKMCRPKLHLVMLDPQILLRCAWIHHRDFHIRHHEDMELNCKMCDFA